MGAIETGGSGEHGPPAVAMPHHRRTTLAVFDGERASDSRSQAGPTLAAIASDAEPSDIATVSIDLVGRLVQANPAARALLGHGAGEPVEGMALATLDVHIPTLEQWIARLVATRQPLPTLATLTGHGSRSVPVTGLFMPDRQQVQVWIAPEVSPARPPAGSEVLTILEQMAEATQAGLAVNTRGPDGTWRLAYVNGRGAQMLGDAPASLVGKSAAPVRGMPDAGRDSTTMTVSTKNGQRIFDVGAGRGTYEGQEAEYVLFRDVTDGQPSEVERKRLVQELFNANVDLRNFARATTHDLRAPLRSISGFAALLERRIRGRLEDDDVRLINNVIASTRRMDQLIEALAAFSAVGSREFDSAQVELNTVLGDVLSDLASELDQRDIHLEFTSLPSVQGDALLLRQLFQNLLGNAVKFRHQVPHKVRIDAERDGAWLVLRFIDNGVGLDLTRAHDLFQPFRRFHDLAKFPGSGLGLATCKRIVELHGGTIEVDSSPGEGAIFTVRLPN